MACQGNLTIGVQRFGRRPDAIRENLKEIAEFTVQVRRLRYQIKHPASPANRLMAGAKRRKQRKAQTTGAALRRSNRIGLIGQRYVPPSVQPLVVIKVKQLPTVRSERVSWMSAEVAGKILHAGEDR